MQAHLTGSVVTVEVPLCSNSFLECDKYKETGRDVGIIGFPGLLGE